MQMTNEHKARGKRIFTGVRDQLRGWRINKKALATAYAIEVGIIGSAAYAGLQFANKYAADTTSTAAINVAQLGDAWSLMPSAIASEWKMMVIGASCFALAEIARLPIIHGLCTTKSWGKKILLTVGVLMAMGVTVKSVSQVAEQTFSPRLAAVRHAIVDLELEKAGLDKLIAQKDSASVTTTPKTDSVARLDEEIVQLNKSLQVIGAPPPDKKVVTQVKHYFTKKNGKKSWKWVDKVTYEPQPWEGKAIVEQIKIAQAKRDAATNDRNQAQETVADREELVASQREVVALKNKAHMEAVGNSQLHSFTAMVLGKNPTEVTDGEVHWFLRFLVFFPAIAVAMVTSLLAISAYEPVRRRQLAVDIELNAPDGTVAQYINDLVHNQKLNGSKEVLA